MLLRTLLITVGWTASVLVSAAVLWFLQGIIQGKKKRNFSSSLTISIIGFAGSFLLGGTPYVGPILSLLPWVLLTKYMLKPPWVKSMIIAIPPWLTLLTIASVIGYVLIKVI